MSRILLIMLMIAVVGCGKDETPRIGANKKKPTSSDDMGPVSIFPDVRISDDTGRPNVTPDMSVADFGTDMTTAVDMMSSMDVGADTSEEVDMGVDMGPNCPRMNVAKGGACMCNQECTTGVCADATTTEDGFCTDGCTSNSDCAAGEACAFDRFGTGYCRTDDTGADCTSGQLADPEACSAGRCVQAGSNYVFDFFCSVECSTSSDCKMGHACAPVHCQYDPQSGYRCITDVRISQQPAATKAQTLAAFTETSKMCVRLGESNPCGAVTMSSDQQACAGAVCDANPTGRCSAGCATTTDCPVGGCVDYDVSDPNLPVRICDI